MLERRELTVNKDYQRGSGIWPEAPSAYFIDTILEGYTFPKIYMYENLDRAARSMRKEIVDGQQRIGAIQRFYRNELRLRSDGANKGKRFQDLDDETQNAFLSYSVPVDVIRNASTSEILQMFRRMNAYTLPLNDAEKRHSAFLGMFKWFVNNVSSELNPFFIEFGVFTERQIIRMADASLISDCVLATERGIISTSPKDLSDLYSKYEDEFPNIDEMHQRIMETIFFISGPLNELRNSFMMKPYAVHSLFTALYHCRYGIPAITEDWGVVPLGDFATNPQQAANQLQEMSRAHEAKELDGPHAEYVWGCLSTTDRKPRRSARVGAIMRALGAQVPDNVDVDVA